MSKLIHLCKVSEIPESNLGKQFIIDDMDIIIYRIAGKLYAIENTCPHNHTHRLHESSADKNNVITCPVHGWRFNIITGERVEAQDKSTGILNHIPLIVENDSIYIEPFKNKFNFKF